MGPKRREDGGPAFPVPAEHVNPYGGMSLRDWFAGQALAGLMANTPVLGRMAQAVEGEKFTAAAATAAAVYGIADAMLKAREL